MASKIRFLRVGYNEIAAQLLVPCPDGDDPFYYQGFRGFYAMSEAGAMQGLRSALRLHGKRTLQRLEARAKALREALESMELGD